MESKVLYLIGSLRNPKIPDLAKRLREEHPDVEVFDDWYAAGPEADDCWKDYEQDRGRDYVSALGGHAAKHVFDFDRHHLDRSTHALLVLPAGKSGHMEITYAKYGVGAKAAILLDPDDDPRFDIMYQFVDRVLRDEKEVHNWLEGENNARDRDVQKFATRGRCLEGRVPDGGWVAGLLP